MHSGKVRHLLVGHFAYIHASSLALHGFRSRPYTGRSSYFVLRIETQPLMKIRSLLPTCRSRLFLLLVVLLFPVASLLSGCNGQAGSTASTAGLKLAPMSEMPAEVQNAPTKVQQAYQFAVANPDAVKNVPCFCGCGSVGHTSNYSCYVKEAKSSGEVVFDQHALGCSICVDITQEVMKLTGEGKDAKQIRASIDQTFSQYGPSNMAPAQ